MRAAERMARPGCLVLHCMCVVVLGVAGLGCGGAGKGTGSGRGGDTGASLTGSGGRSGLGGGAAGQPGGGQGGQATGAGGLGAGSGATVGSGGTAGSPAAGGVAGSMSGAGGIGGTSTTGNGDAGSDSVCVPACWRRMLGGYFPGGSCTYVPGRFCWSNGFKMATGYYDGAAGQAYFQDGVFCAVQQFSGKGYTYYDSKGTVLGVLETSADGSFTLTCTGESPVTVASDCPPFLAGCAYGTCTVP